MRIERVQSGGGKLNVRVLVITADKFEDLELLVPYFRLLDEGARVDIAAPTMDEIEGENGYRILPDLTIESVDPDHYDAVLVPGGAPDGAPSVVRRNEFAKRSCDRSPRRGSRLRRSAMVLGSWHRPMSSRESV